MERFGNSDHDRGRIGYREEAFRWAGRIVFHSDHDRGRIGYREAQNGFTHSLGGHIKQLTRAAAGDVGEVAAVRREFHFFDAI